LDEQIFTLGRLLTTMNICAKMGIVSQPGSHLIVCGTTRAIIAALTPSLPAMRTPDSAAARGLPAATAVSYHTAALRSLTPAIRSGNTAHSRHQELTL